MKRLATYMNAMCAKLKVRLLKILLIVFCITGILLFGHVLLYPKHSFEVIQIRRPKDIFKREINERRMYNEAVYRRIKKFKSMLNDSVIKARPGLKDTLHYLELFYQFKK